MTKEFELRLEQEIDATPEQVWDAIATGPGIDSWFMGRSEVVPGVGNTISTDMGEGAMSSTITAWEPGKHLAYKGEPAPDGRFMAFEYLLEGRDGGSTVLRYVHSGVLGDDWEKEYDALRKGSPMYLAKLATYLKYFPGRTSTHDAFVVGGQMSEEDLWARVGDLLGVSVPIAEGAAVRVAPGELAPTDGVVQFASLPTFVGVRTPDSILTFIHGMGTAVVEQHHFADVDGDAVVRAWRSWLAS